MEEKLHVEVSFQSFVLLTKQDINMQHEMLQHREMTLGLQGRTAGTQYKDAMFGSSAILTIYKA